MVTLKDSPIKIIDPKTKQSKELNNSVEAFKIILIGYTKEFFKNTKFKDISTALPYIR